MADKDGKHVAIRISVETDRMMTAYIRAQKAGGSKRQLADKAIQDFIRYETQIKKKF